MCGGPQIVHLMDQFFRTRAHMGTVYSIMDLSDLQFRGDVDLPNFRYNWDTILDRTRDRLEDQTLEERLVRKKIWLITIA